MPGVPFQIYTKFTPFEEKLDVGFKFLAGQKKGREYRDWYLRPGLFPEFLKIPQMQKNRKLA